MVYLPNSFFSGRFSFLCCFSFFFCREDVSNYFSQNAVQKKKLDRLNSFPKWHPTERPFVVVFFHRFKNSSRIISNAENLTYVISRETFFYSIKWRKGKIEIIKPRTFINYRRRERWKKRLLAHLRILGSNRLQMRQNEDIIQKKLILVLTENFFRNYIIWTFSMKTKCQPCLLKPWNILDDPKLFGRMMRERLKI